MIKNIYILLLKYCYLFFLKIGLINLKLPSDNYEFNHLNIFFNQNKYIKNNILNKNYFKRNKNIQKDYYYNTFDWLISAKLLGGAESIYFSKNQIKFWKKEKYYKNNIFWNEYYNSKRLINLVYSYDFYAVSSNEKEMFFFQKLILEHYIINNIYIKNLNCNKLSIESTKANLLLRLIYKKNINKIIDLIKKQLLINIDINGFHRSYNAVTQAEFLNNIIEINNIILFFKIERIKEITFQIHNMTSVLSTFFHKDSSIALFNGSHNSFNKIIINMIKQKEDIKIKKLYLIKNGLVEYSDKDKKIFYDVVKPSNKNINNNLHAGTLSFELSAKKEKIITNCGSINKIYSNKPDYLRYSAAHSTIILNNTNISELDNKKSYVRIPETIKYESSENENHLILVASHDGYKENFKKIIKRKLTISKYENKIIGKDSIMPIKLNSKKISYSIRFHIMPHCQCNLTNSKKTVIIKTGNRNTWVFESNIDLNIEESIFIENDKIHQNKQIVIYGFINDTIKNIDWILREVTN